MLQAFFKNKFQRLIILSQDFQLTCISRLKIAWIVSRLTQIAGDNIKINGNGLAALKELQWNLDLTKGQGTGKLFLFAILWRFRYIKVFFHTFYYYWGKENSSLY